MLSKIIVGLLKFWSISIHIMVLEVNIVNMILAKRLD